MCAEQVREHLELFSRIKNVPEFELNASVDGAMRKMDLLRYSNKLAGALSGGNKRKLCVAIAIIGQPGVVFLDEVTALNSALAYPNGKQKQTKQNETPIGSPRLASIRLLAASCGISSRTSAPSGARRPSS